MKNKAKFGQSGYYMQKDGSCVWVKEPKGWSNLRLKDGDLPRFWFTPCVRQGKHPHEKA